MKSMTGYGRGEAIKEGRTVTVEVRSVNNRYLDCTIKMPRTFIFAEEAIKGVVQSHVSRGKVDVFVTIGPSPEGDVSIAINRPVADGYYAALQEMKETYGLHGELTVGSLSRFQDVFLVEKKKDNIEQFSQHITQVLEIALQDYDAMRLREGLRLKEDILSRALTIENLAKKVEERAPGIVADYRTRLAKKMEEILEKTQIEESRILTEAAIFADKVAVDEEIVRLSSHLAQLRLLLEEEIPVGRKLDFLIQEFNREANTIGSKCNDVETARYVVDIKAEIEKIREQIQNME